MRRTMTAAAIFSAIAALAACGSPSSTSSSSTSSTPDSAPNLSTVAAPAGLSCTDIGGAFVPHGTDGSGDCEPADQRPECHKPPAAQDEHYVAGFDLTPPRADGTVGAAQVRTMLLGVPPGVPAASNADCWRLPPG